MAESIKIKTAFNLYLQKGNFAESSAAIKNRALNHFVELFGDIPIGLVTYGHGEDLRAYLSNRTSNCTCNIYLKNLLPFFKWLVKRDFIEKNPLSELKLLPAGELRKQTYSPQEIERILTVANLRWQVIVLLGLQSLRRSEVLNLVVADIDFEKNFIMVSPKKDTASTWKWDIKNHIQDLVPLPEKIKILDLEINLHQLLFKLIDELPAGQPYVCLKPIQYQRILQLKHEGKLTWQEQNQPAGNFSRDFRSLCRRAKVKPRRFHDLRATFATAMSMNGLSLPETQKLMRHSSPQTTAMYYISLNSEILLKKALKVSENCYSPTVQETV